MVLRPRSDQQWNRTVFVVMEADGSRSQTVFETEEGQRQLYDLQWSADSQRLFMLTNVTARSGAAQATEVAVWQASAPNARPAVARLAALVWSTATPLLDGRLLVIGGERSWIIDKRGQKQRLRGALEKALVNSEVAGVAKDGRLFVQMHEGYLAAVSLDTGQVARIYP
jgi:hypothetical protein